MRKLVFILSIAGLPLIALGCGGGSGEDEIFALTVTVASPTAVNLSWNKPPARLYCCADYIVRRDGQLLNVVVGHALTDENLKPDTRYCYVVEAYEAVIYSKFLVGRTDETCVTTLAL